MFEKDLSTITSSNKESERIMTFAEYEEEQRKLIFSQENIKEATEYFGHTPDIETVDGRNELGQYFVISGQAAEFAKSHQHA